MKKLILTAVFLTINTFSVQARDIQYTIRVDGISCPFCVATSEKALKKIAGVRDVKSDLKKGTITVCANAEEVSLTDKQLMELFKKNGFTYRGMETADRC